MKAVYLLVLMLGSMLALAGPQRAGAAGQAEEEHAQAMHKAHGAEGESTGSEAWMEQLHELLMSEEGFHYFGMVSRLAEGGFVLLPQETDFAAGFFDADMPAQAAVSFDGDTMFIAGDEETDAAMLSDGLLVVVLGRRTEAGADAMLIADEAHLRDHLEKHGKQMQDQAQHAAAGHHAAAEQH